MKGVALALVSLAALTGCELFLDSPGKAAGEGGDNTGPGGADTTGSGAATTSTGSFGSGLGGAGGMGGSASPTGGMGGMGGAGGAGGAGASTPNPACAGQDIGLFMPNDLTSWCTTNLDGGGTFAVEPSLVDSSPRFRIHTGSPDWWHYQEQSVTVYREVCGGFTFTTSLAAVDEADAAGTITLPFHGAGVVIRGLDGSDNAGDWVMFGLGTTDELNLTEYKAKVWSYVDGVAGDGQLYAPPQSAPTGRLGVCRGSDGNFRFARSDGPAGVGTSYTLNEGPSPLGFENSACVQVGLTAFEYWEPPGAAEDATIVGEFAYAAINGAHDTDAGCANAVDSAP